MAPAFHRVCWLTYEGQSGFAVVVTVAAAETAALTFHRPRSRMAVSSVVSSVTDQPRPRNPPTASAASRRTARLLPKQPNAPPSPTGAMLYWLMSGCSNAWNRRRNPRSSGSMTRPSTAPTDGSAKCAAISPAHSSGTHAVRVREEQHVAARGVDREVEGGLLARERRRVPPCSRAPAPATEAHPGSARTAAACRPSTGRRRGGTCRSGRSGARARRAGRAASPPRCAPRPRSPRSGADRRPLAERRNARSARSTFTSPAHPTAWKRSTARLAAA